MAPIFEARTAGGTIMPVLALVVIGAAAGLFATRIMRLDLDLISTLAIGILGALVGGLVLRMLLTVTGWAAGFVGAVLGAMLLIWLWRTYGPRRR
jgi:uncharacterized membrane protein YeaQ/YmgE (transglycosylase-associated protein family)